MDLDERVPPLRIKVGYKRSLSPWIFAIIFVFLMGILLVLFLLSPFGRVEHLHIEGNRLLTEKEILQIIRLQKGSPHFHFNLSQAKHQLEKCPEIQHVEIKRSFPSKIYIRVKEFPVVAVMQRKDGQFAPVLSNGAILPHRRTTDMVDSGPVIEQKDYANSTLQLALRNFVHVPKKIRKEIEWIHLVKNRPDQVMLLSKNRHQIYVRANELHQKLLYYPFFQKHPEGKLYLLQGIWFSPE